MKKVIIAVLLLAGFTTMAQKGERGTRDGRDGMQDLSSEQMATLQTKKMTLVLDLTQKQQEQIKSLQLEKAKRRKAKMEGDEAQKEAGEAKKPTSEERFTMMNGRLDRQIAQKAEMKKILSDEQYKKWDQHQQRKNKHGKSKHHNGKRGDDAPSRHGKDKRK